MNYQTVKHLLAPDAQAGVSSDPLDVNTDDVNIDYPILPSTYYKMQVGTCKVEPNSKGTGDLLIAPLKTTETVKDKKGEEVLPGHTITHRISLAETEKRDINMIKKDVVRLCRACGISTTVRAAVSNPSMFDGKVIERVKIKVNRETEEFPESNSVAGFGTDKE